MRFGIVKSENFVFICLSSHLSLYLQSDWDSPIRDLHFYKAFLLYPLLENRQIFDTEGWSSL